MNKKNQQDRKLQAKITKDTENIREAHSSSPISTAFVFLLVRPDLDYVHHYRCNESYVHLMREHWIPYIHHGSFVKR